jgi:hypothetical protein
MFIDNNLVVQEEVQVLQDLVLVNQVADDRLVAVLEAAADDVN